MLYTCCGSQKQTRSTALRVYISMYRQLYIHTCIHVNIYVLQQHEITRNAALCVNMYVYAHIHMYIFACCSSTKWHATRQQNPPPPLSLRLIQGGWGVGGGGSTPRASNHLHTLLLRTPLEEREVCQCVYACMKICAEMSLFFSYVFMYVLHGCGHVVEYHITEGTWGASVCVSV